MYRYMSSADSVSGRPLHPGPGAFEHLNQNRFGKLQLHEHQKRLKKKG